MSEPPPDFFDDKLPEGYLPPNPDQIKTHCIYACEQGPSGNVGFLGPLDIGYEGNPTCKWYCFGDDLNPAKQLQNALVGIDAMKNQILGFIMEKNMMDNMFVLTDIIPAIMGGNTVDGIKEDILDAVAGMKGADKDWVMQTLLPSIEQSAHNVKENVFELIDQRDDEWRDWIADVGHHVYEHTTDIGRKLGRGLQQGEVLGKVDVAKWIGNRVADGVDAIRQWIEDNLPSP